LIIQRTQGVLKDNESTYNESTKREHDEASLASQQADVTVAHAVILKVWFATNYGRKSPDTLVFHPLFALQGFNGR
jgi:hypothetical protein